MRFGRADSSRVASRVAIDGGLHKAAEERMRGGWFRLELGMELDRQEPRVVGQFDDLDQAAIGLVPEKSIECASYC